MSHLLSGYRCEYRVNDEMARYMRQVAELMQPYESAEGTNVDGVYLKLFLACLARLDKDVVRSIMHGVMQQAAHTAGEDISVEMDLGRVAGLTDFSVRDLLPQVEPLPDEDSDNFVLSCASCDLEAYRDVKGKVYYDVGYIDDNRAVLYDDLSIPDRTAVYVLDSDIAPMVPSWIQDFVRDWVEKAERDDPIVGWDEKKGRLVRESELREKEVCKRPFFTETALTESRAWAESHFRAFGIGEDETE